MSSGLSTNNPTIVSAFRSLLGHQALFAVVILVLLALAWNLLRGVQLRQARAGGPPVGALLQKEAAGRRLLRIGFGLLWIFDGLLQAQPSMPLGMTSRVIEPTAAASPLWVQHLVNAGATIWGNHPITVPASAVWIQVGLGIWLIVAPRGYWSRLAGLAAGFWGIIVWIFGESFGGVFAPALTWAFGAPGAVLFYSLAGLLIALPERTWSNPRLGRAVLSVMGLFFVGMAVLQAWPGRGFWQGQGHHAAPGTLTGMVQQMSATPQPAFISSWLASFAAFDAAHGWAVNLFLVTGLAAIGVGFMSRRAAVARVAMCAGIVLCIADWVLIEDFGFFGGVGTDPNSMIPMSLVFVAGYLAMTRVPAVSGAPVPIVTLVGEDSSFRARLASRPAYAFRSIAAVAAIGITLIGVVPMAGASVNPNADPIIAEAIDGPPGVVDTPAPVFRLVDQNGATVSLQSLHGKAVAVTFLDPVCVSDCPLIAQEFRQADDLLASAGHRVALVAVVANPVYRARAYLVAFDRQEGLQQLSNWHFLTGSRPELTRVWSSFGIQVAFAPGGAMIAHSDICFVIDPAGHMRYVLDTNPGPGTEASKSSFAVLLADELRAVLGS